MQSLKLLYGRLYTRRRALVYLFYGLVAGVSYFLAFALRFEFDIPPQYFSIFAATVPVLIGVRLLAAGVFQLSSGRWRFISTPDVMRLVAATTAGSILLFGANMVMPPELVVPRSVLLVDWVLTTYGTAAVWLAYRLAFERIRHVRHAGRGPRRRAVIVGAGEAGNMLGREIQRFPTGYRVVAYVDDEPEKWGSRLQGVEVLGGTDQLAAIVRARKAVEVILAIPSARPADLRRLVERCEQAKVPFKVLPGIAEVLSGHVDVGDLRELRIEDLLGREPIELELPELARDVKGKTVLITGAAGSIGGELARQVGLHRPERLLLFDQAETPLFYLELELRELYPELELVPIIGDVVSREWIDQVFRQWSPERVFHAAAYKHVPMLEANGQQAVGNNVLGTRCVAEAAGRHGCEKFVLVSTDKAVRPANVMGATKRLAELVILELQDQYPRTAYGAVRFGNVLGSNGSVVPIFKRQLERVRPLTVTHPDVTRYFMTISEAVQLILQASLLPEFRGHIAMLEMGEPVKILDLAKNFLRLSGIAPRHGETIVFTGLRPGEKLHEELSAPDEEAVETDIAKVMLLRTRSHDEGRILALVDRWELALSMGRGPEVVRELRSIFDAEGHTRRLTEEPILVEEPVLNGAAQGAATA